MKEQDTLDFFRKKGISCIRSAEADSMEKALILKEDMGLPLVLRGRERKTIRTDEEMEREYPRISGRMPVILEEALEGKMSSVGYRVDSSYGKLIILKHEGAESTRLIPIRRRDAKEMTLDALGEKDIKAAEIIFKIAELADRGEIEEMDIEMISGEKTSVCGIKTRE